MFRGNLWMRVFLLLLFFALPLAAQQAATSPSRAQPPATTTIFACVNSNTGAVRIVSNNTVCKTTEHKTNWNHLGPPGPQGNRGPVGAQGTQGATGAAGSTGPQGLPGVSVGKSANGSDISLTTDFPGVLVAQTPAVAAGTYFVSASTLLEVAVGDAAFCYTTTPGAGAPNFGGSGVSGAFTQASTTDVFSVDSGAIFQLFCYSHQGASVVFEGSLTATLINNASSSKKASRLTAHPQ
jgi:hypothetical protein